MADRTSIEWTDATWNPVFAWRKTPNPTGRQTGWHCEHVSEGCRNCYAERMNRRLGNGLDYKPGLRDQVEIGIEKRHAPLRWRKPRHVFVGSMTDIFADFVTDDMLDRIFAVMALCPQHRFQLLTKRPERMRDYLASCPPALRVAAWKKAIEDHGNSLGPDMEDFDFFARIGWHSELRPCKPDCERPCRLVMPNGATHAVRARDYDGEARSAGECHGQIRWDGDLSWPLPNVWLGVSVEDQATADARIPLLLDTPAATRFVSYEPALGPVDWQHGNWISPRGGGPRVNLRQPWADPLPGLDWIICGGESGPHARPMHPDWARSARDQCAAAGVAFFMKQLSGEHGRAIKDIDRFPGDLRIREFPNAS